MKRLIFSLVALLVIFGLAQNPWIIGEDVLTDGGNAFYRTNVDSVFFDEDTLYIAGAETLEIYVNMDNTLGMVRLMGTVQNKDTLGYSSTDDDIHFYVARHKGTATTARRGITDPKNSNITETFYAMDSVEQSAGTVGSFDVYPLSNTTLDDQAVPYLTFRIYGIADQISAVWMKLEKVRAY